MSLLTRTCHRQLLIDALCGIVALRFDKRVTRPTNIVEDVVAVGLRSSWNTHVARVWSWRLARSVKCSVIRQAWR